MGRRETLHLIIALFLSSFSAVLCDNVNKKSTVLVGLLIRNKGHTLPYFLSLLEDLDYPKNRMTLSIRSDNNIDDTLEILKHWIDSVGHKYHAIDFIADDESSGLRDEKSIADWPISRFLHVINLREGILKFGRKIWADYLFMLDADVFLTNPATLDLLISKEKSVAAPLVKSDGMYSNFWAGMAQDYYYVRTDKYEPILNREDIGCHQVPMVHSALLIDLRKFESDSLTYNFENLKNYDGPKDDIIAFALSAKMANVSLNICNDQLYGYILVPLESQDSLENDIEQLTNLKLEILAREKSLGVHESMRKFVKYPKKDSLGFDMVYMINLKRRPDRRARMEQCFQELGIFARTVDAVDGRILDEMTLKELGVKMIPDFVDPYHKRRMTMGEIGCFLSHYGVWKDMIDNNYAKAMILEDDVRFEPFFRQKIGFVVKEIERLKLDWDLVYLGRKRLLDQDEPLVNGTRVLVHVGYSYWTIGYILSQRGARKLMEAKPLENMIPVDEYLPILFDRHPRVAWKKYFPKRDLVGLSVTPLIIYPTHYTGESGYVSDTENSKVIAVEKIRQTKEEL